MRYVRFKISDNLPTWGILLQDDLIQPISAPPYSGGVPHGQTVALQTVHLLAPCEPSKIVAVGKNYYDHIQELDNKIPETPIIFIKPATCLNDPDNPIILPTPDLSVRIDYEGELALVISRKAKNIRAEDAADYVLGYTCLNDVTARDIQQKDGQWTRAKGFDGFAPVGPVLTDEIDPLSVNLCTRLNGRIVQESSTSMLIWPVHELIAFISQVMTLLPGDIITTGTPGGIGPMQPGDVVEVSIDGIGILRNPVVSAPAEN
jgi:2-keto-4-pentenoate hydratase/2-oxohepta-3-ene-1,7-dioic acid hydratase in catechol pathway